ncbi:MAG: histidinol-phosphate transaminase [Wenzhouxiangellaceae bacterium]
MSLVNNLARPEILALQAYSSARSIAPDDGILLNANENPWPPAADNGLALNRYPDPQPPALVQTLAQLYGLRTTQLLLTRGSDEGIDLLVRAFCAAGKDSVAICPPCFGMYEIAARIQGARILRYPLAEATQFAPDFRALAQTQAKLVFLCSPNNPTGNLLSRDRLLDLAVRLDGRALLVIDEAYIEFAETDSMTSLIDEYPNVVVLRTLSKAWAMAGARLGAVAADSEVIALLRKIIPPYPLPKPTVQMALNTLGAANQHRMREQVELLTAERQRMAQRLSRLPVIKTLFPSAANFLLVRVADAPSLVAAARSQGILLRDQSRQPGLHGCVRISIGDPQENDTLLNWLETV